MLNTGGLATFSMSGAREAKKKKLLFFFFSFAGKERLGKLTDLQEVNNSRCQAKRGGAGHRPKRERRKPNEASEASERARRSLAKRYLQSFYEISGGKYFPIFPLNISSRLIKL